MLRERGLLIVVTTAESEYLICDHLGFGPDDVARFANWIDEETAEEREAHKQIDFQFATCA